MSTFKTTDMPVVETGKPFASAWMNQAIHTMLNSLQDPEEEDYDELLDDEDLLDDLGDFEDDDDEY